MSKPIRLPYETTLEVRDRCLCLQAQRAARALARYFDEAFRPLALTNGQFSLLMSLNRLEPPTIGAVADLLAMDRTTLTAALKPLQRRGLLAISVDRGDRRNRRLVLTEAGGALLAEAAVIWRRRHAVIDARLEEAGAGTLQESLKVVPALLS